MDTADTARASVEKPRRALVSLRAQLIAYFAVLFLAVLGPMFYVQMYGIPYTDFRGETGYIRDEVFANASLTADLKKQHLMSWIAERRGDSHAFSSTALIALETDKLIGSINYLRRKGLSGLSLGARAAEHDSSQLLRQHLQTMMLAYGVYSSISIADIATGRIIVSTEEDRFDEDISGLEALKRSALMRDAGLGDIHIDQHSQELTLTVAHPISQEIASESRVRAMLVLNANVNAIIRPLLRAGGGMGETGEALLVNKDGTVLVELKHRLVDGTIARPLQHRITARPAQLGAHGQEGLIETVDYRGVPVLAAYRHLRVSPSFGWGMVVKIDRKEAFAGLRRIIAIEAATNTLGLIVVIIATVLMASRLSRPIRRLNETAQLIATGDLDARAVPVGSTEVWHLANTFNHMAERVQMSVSDLERTVHQRTKEVETRIKELEQIVYIASHDLRSPLVNIEGYRKVLQTDLKKLNDIIATLHVPPALDEEISFLMTKDIPEASNYIAKSTAQMESLLSALLRLSRFGRLAVDIKSLDMNVLVRDVAESADYQIKQCDIDLVISDLPECRGDSAYVKQIFANLLDNAIKYRFAGRRSSIAISGVRIKNLVRYCVEDDGVGIAPRYQARIFELFHRLAPNIAEGDGLGLTIVNLAANRMGGEITVESAPGEGSRFYVILPAG